MHHEADVPSGEVESVTQMIFATAVLSWMILFLSNILFSLFTKGRTSNWTPALPRHQGNRLHKFDFSPNFSNLSTSCLGKKDSNIDWIGKKKKTQIQLRKVKSSLSSIYITWILQIKSIYLMLLSVYRFKRLKVEWWHLASSRPYL